MEMEIINILTEVLAIIFIATAAYLMKKVYASVKSKLSVDEGKVLDDFIGKLVAAAEQMLCDDDPDGTARMAYVQEMLIKAGYEISDIIMATIESKVHDLNLAKKAVSK